MTSNHDDDGDGDCSNSNDGGYDYDDGVDDFFSDSSDGEDDHTVMTMTTVIAMMVGISAVMETIMMVAMILWMTKVIALIAE